MNTRIAYEYRDAGGWSQYEEVVIEGELTERDEAFLKDMMDGGEFFIPADLGLEELQSRMPSYPSDLDHIWHKWEWFSLTDEAPTVELTADKFRTLLQDVHALGWNETAAFKRHGFLGAW